MNKSYKVISNKVTGQRVVASELAKGKGKAKRISLGMVAVLALSSGNTWATCTAGPIVLCTGQDQSYVANGGDSFTRILVNGGTGTGALELNGNTFNNNTTAVTAGVQAGTTTLDVKGNTSLTATNSGSTSLWAVASNGDSKITIDQDAVLNIENKNTGSSTGDGIEASGKNASVSHLGSGNITVYGGYGVFVTATAAAGRADVVLGKDVSIETQGAGNRGIYANASAVGGHTEIQTNATITTDGNSAHGVSGQANNQGTVKVVNGVDGFVTTHGNTSYGLFTSTLNQAAEIENYGTVITTGTGKSIGIYGASAGNTLITNSGKVEILGTVDPTMGNLAIYGTNTAASDVKIITTTTSDVSVSGTNSDNIYARTTVGGNLTIQATGQVSNVTDVGATNFGIVIQSTGTSTGGNQSILFGESLADKITMSNTSATNYSAALHAAQLAGSGAGDITVTNKGTLETNGFIIHGIHTVDNALGKVSVINDGLIHIKGRESRGIQIDGMAGSNISVTNNGEILHDAGTAYQYGIHSVSGNNSTTTINNNGKISGSLYGIVAWNNGQVQSGGKSTINIGTQGFIDSGIGIIADMSDENTVNIAQGGHVNGKTSGMLFRSIGAAAKPKDTVNNAGLITSDRDTILQAAFASTGASLTVNNEATGVMTGVITANNPTTNINNAGTWNLRKTAYTTVRGARDTLSVAISNLGTSGDNHIVNSGTLNLLGDDGVSVTLDNTGEYATGYAVNTMALGGAVQGQLLGVQTFTNSGVIDLTTNSKVGDVLVISGSNTAGTSGSGVYVADGGQLKLDTLLNKSGTNSQSDMLILDGTQLGRGATSIIVNNMGGSGAQTVDNGIELVRVLDAGRSESNVFKLGSRTTSGLYEYDLFHGGIDADASNGNWYLRSLVTPANPDTSIIAVEPTVYLRNLSAASNMFMHTLHDRLGEPQFTDTYKIGESNPSSVWVRVVGNHTESKGGNGQIDLDTDTSLVHIGGDIARWSNGNNDRLNIGLMGAYGHSKIDAKANQLTVTPSGFERKATGKIDGYSIGAYATWYGNQDKPTGAYIDTWAQYGWYDNKVQGNAQKEESYNSTGWTASVEAGYALIARDTEHRQLMIEPQVQIAYNNYSADDHTDASGTRITDSDANGVITRIGARLYSRSKLNDNGVQPFIEVNWWYSDAKNTLAFNGETMSDGTPSSRYELKAGLQGEVAKNWLMWGHVGGQWGEKSYSRYEGMVGIKRLF